jgi:deoxycytidylate deaminase
VNRRLTPESPTAYNWMAENFLAADFIGITSSQQAGFSFDATFPLYRDDAVSVIKKSIDRLTGAVIWKDGFIVVTGYNDDNGVLYYTDGCGDDYKTMSYAEFGLNKSPYWYYQVFEDRIELDEREMIKESLLQAVYKWESHDLMLPETEYACGRHAYDALIQAFRSGDYDHAGAREVLQCYRASKRQIGLYAELIRNRWEEIGGIADQYAVVARLFQSMLDTGQQADRLVSLLSEAHQAEEKAIQLIKLLLRETIDNRYGDVSLR